MLARARSPVPTSWPGIGIDRVGGVRGMPIDTGKGPAARQRKNSGCPGSAASGLGKAAEVHARSGSQAVEHGDEIPGGHVARRAPSMRPPPEPPGRSVDDRHPAGTRRQHLREAHAAGVVRAHGQDPHGELLRRVHYVLGCKTCDGSRGGGSHSPNR